MGAFTRSSWLLIMSLALPCGPASAQSLLATGGQPTVVEPQTDVPSWGTTGTSLVVVAGTDLTPWDPAATYVFDLLGLNGITMYQSGGTSGNSNWIHGVQIPSGALIVNVTLEACDTSATAEVAFNLVKHPAPGGSATIVAQGTTGLAPSPGCAFFVASPGAPTQVSNGSETYWVQVGFAGATALSGAVRVNSIRVAYRLQISPAPGTASFADVPVGHPLHRFVEALAAAGITTGCGGGNYCPDALVTRGQIAVFLAVALGLHFPN
jgi:hypothetical protein